METQLHLSGNTVYWKTRKLGTIYPSESTFESVKRTPKNIFNLFNGLGLNKQLLDLLYQTGIKTIEVPYSDKTLITTTIKWLTKGIPLPQQYCSDKVDEQLILPMNLINLDEDIPAIEENMQLSLFDIVNDDTEIMTCLEGGDK